MKPCMRLAVFQASDSESVLQIRQDFDQAKRQATDEPGFERGEVFSEDDDNMVVFMTVWSTRDDAEHFDSCPFNLLLMSLIYPRIVGTPVIRLFNIHEGVAA